MSLRFLPYSLAESYSIKDFSLCYKTMPQVLLPFPNSWDSLTSQMMIHILIYPILITTIFYIPGLLFISEQGMATIRPLKRYRLPGTGLPSGAPPYWALPSHGSGYTWVKGLSCQEEDRGLAESRGHPKGGQVSHLAQKGKLGTAGTNPQSKGPKSTLEPRPSGPAP